MHAPRLALQPSTPLAHRPCVRFAQTPTEGDQPPLPKHWRKVMPSTHEDQLTLQAFNYLQRCSENPFDPKVRHYHWRGLAEAVQHQQAYVVTAPSSIHTPETAAPFLNQTIQTFASLPPTHASDTHHKALVMVFPGIKAPWPLHTALNTETTSQILDRHHMAAAQLGPQAAPLFQTPFHGVALKPNSAQAMLRQLATVQAILEGTQRYVEKKLPDAPKIAASYHQIRQRMMASLLDVEA